MSLQAHHSSPDMWVTLPTPALHIEATTERYFIYLLYFFFFSNCYLKSRQIWAGRSFFTAKPQP